MTPKPSCFLTVLCICLAVASPAHVQGDPSNALKELDAYLVQAARSDPAYRTDIKRDDVPDRSAGRFPGYSSFLGSFSYRPKTYGELSRSERAELLSSAAFHSFLAAGRGSLDIEIKGPISAPPRQFSVSAAEMLRTQAVTVMIPPP
jgi:hypothetical protein